MDTLCVVEPFVEYLFEKVVIVDVLFGCLVESFICALFSDVVSSYDLVGGIPIAVKKSEIFISSFNIGRVTY